MSGPWEQYQSAVVADGPWSRYAAPEAAKPFTAADVPFTQNVAAGMGMAVRNAHLGLRQIGAKVGIGDEGAIQAEVDEERKIQAPLSASGGGKVGEALGTVGMAMLAPGAGTVGGATAAGAALGAVQPTSGDESRLLNTAIGGAGGVAGKMVGDKVAGAIASKLSGATTKATTDEAQLAVRDAALKAGQQAGYVVPPSTVNPTLANKTLESVGGKIGTEQAASVKNQAVTDSLARRALGLNDSATLTDATLAAMRKAAGKAYEDVKQFGQQVNLKLKADQPFQQDISAIGADIARAAREFPESTKNAAIEALKMDLARGAWSPGAIVEKVKSLRFEAKTNFKSFDDPAKIATARAQREVADALDGLLERQLGASGQGQLATDYQAARVTIAKIHDVEAALSGAGHVDARVLARMGEKQGTLTDELATIADFAAAFPKAVSLPEKIGSAGVHTARAGLGGAVGLALDGAGGFGVGTVAGVAAPMAARAALLSRPGQAMMATPSYGVNPLLKYGAPTTNALARYMAGGLGTAPALTYGNRRIPADGGE